MSLNADQHDALTEVINIAFARAAAALSDLTGERVELEVPEISVLPLPELPKALARLTPGETASVHQIFRGPIAGDALMLLDYTSATKLTELLLSDERTPNHLNTSAREVLTEVGNILLNACLGIFGNLLQVHVSFAVPRLHLSDLTRLINSIAIDDQSLSSALVVHTAFSMRGDTVAGYLVFILGFASLEQLIAAIEQLG